MMSGLLPAIFYSIFAAAVALGGAPGPTMRLGTSWPAQGQTTCIVYRKPPGRILHVRAVRTSHALPADFKPGAFDELVLHRDVGRRAPTSTANRSRDFGARLFLHCIDPTKPSVAWACDARSCVPRTFRDNAKMRAFRKTEDSPTAAARTTILAGR